MTTIQQKPDPKDPKDLAEPKEVTLTFRCDEAWKRQVISKLGLRGETLKDAAVSALSGYLGIDLPKVNAA